MLLADVDRPQRLDLLAVVVRVAVEGERFVADQLVGAVVEGQLLWGQWSVTAWLLVFFFRGLA